MYVVNIMYMRSRKWPGNEAIGTHVIYSESEEALASSASMLGTPMLYEQNSFIIPEFQVAHTGLIYSVAEHITPLIRCLPPLSSHTLIQYQQ